MENFAIIVIGAGSGGLIVAIGAARAGRRVLLIDQDCSPPGTHQSYRARVLQQAGVQTVAGTARFTDPHILHVTEKSGRSYYVRGKKMVISTNASVQLKELDLKLASVEFSEKGIKIDKYGRTNRRHIFALGNVEMPPLFSPKTKSHGRSILTTLLLPGPFKKRLEINLVTPFPQS